MSNYTQKWNSAADIIPDFAGWLIPPTLEDIVQMCLNRFPKKTALQLNSLMRVQISKLYCDTFLNCQSFKELWLLYYMFVYHTKRFNEAKKEWEDV